MPDTTQRNKLMGMLNQFYDIDPQFAKLQLAGQQALDKSFGAAQQNIGAQFTPAFRLAQARLGGSPLLADSGYANRLNRQLQQGAFGQLSNAYGSAAAQQALGQQNSLADMINARFGGAGQLLQAGLTAPKKRKEWQQLAATAGGAALGSIF